MKFGSTPQTVTLPRRTRDWDLLSLSESP